MRSTRLSAPTRLPRAWPAFSSAPEQLPGLQHAPGGLFLASGIEADARLLAKRADGGDFHAELASHTTWAFSQYGRAIEKFVFARRKPFRFGKLRPLQGQNLLVGIIA